MAEHQKNGKGTNQYAIKPSGPTVPKSPHALARQERSKVVVTDTKQQVDLAAIATEAINDVHRFRASLNSGSEIPVDEIRNLNKRLMDISEAGPDNLGNVVAHDIARGETTSPAVLFALGQAVDEGELRKYLSDVIVVA